MIAAVNAANADNGNIPQIINGRDGNRTQNFTYDAFNRLTQASSNGSNWGEAFTTDPWGNLWQRSPVTSKTNSEPLNAPRELAEPAFRLGPGADEFPARRPFRPGEVV